MKIKPYTPDNSTLAYSVGVTLDRFIKKKQDDFPFASGELSQLLRDIALATKIVNRETNRAGLSNIGGAFGQTNVQGEEQQKLDVIANIRFTRALTKGGEVCAVVSEEDDEVIDLQNSSGKYVIAIDPLDGSSNIDVNISIGTIFSIYRRVTPTGSPIQPEDIMQPGNQQVAAGYVLYGSSTMLVYTTGNGVNGFTYEQSLGEFFLSHPDICAPKTGKIYSINEGSYHSFEDGLKSYLDHCKRKEYNARYIGSLVADFHRNLLKGGIYIYPKTKKSPTGKLRLLYEANALAFIAEQAGARATDGKDRILDIIPNSLHQRTPLYIGSTKMVVEAESFLEVKQESIHEK
ncbi:fructose-1,6-bisphosphatase [Rhodonellum psychrophilum GCM71 = DSM 17998]|uniref:Fructose-1,6-bisphosphatase class 1 n=2 Tax=Rhodonellum TaxID=336827 RepID=U5C9I7_9BACT|nr:MULTISPECIES: class 1 fructose-bisphosphatase [Rhodonellum]ERM84832.1 fructose-1,6-bisphosphatase [Rhodonellum psychrophilum GCM71 = DSM 17998]MDO9552085.1 class 1 fructose-bisphosphatase [Rhodonellum sp.]SDY71300.1 D-fructose 1,6-bisphosphatase [Rhodonellum ikkaensis]